MAATKNNGTLTEDQLKFIEKCEADFTDRYTDKDEDFVKESEVTMDPLIMEVEQYRNYENRRQYHGDNRHRPYRNDRNDRRDNYRDHDRRRYR